MREQHLHHETFFLEEDVSKVPVKGSLPNWGKNAPEECSSSFQKGLAFRAEGSVKEKDSSRSP